MRDLILKNLNSKHFRKLIAWLVFHTFTASNPGEKATQYFLKQLTSAQDNEQQFEKGKDVPDYRGRILIDMFNIELECVYQKYQVRPLYDVWFQFGKILGKEERTLEEKEIMARIYMKVGIRSKCKFSNSLGTHRAFATQLLLDRSICSVQIVRAYSSRQTKG